MSALSFQYKAIDKTGTKRTGVMQAANESEAFRRVTSLGLTPVHLKAMSGPGSAKSGSLGRLGIGSKRIKPKDLAHFTYQLGVLVSSRIPLSEGLRSIAEQEKEGTLKSVIADVAARIESGESIAASLSAHSEAFGAVYIESIRAAEQSGSLAKVMEHLSDMLERTQEMRSQVRGALTYPICVVGVLGIAVTFLIGFVVPRFATMFQQRNIELPMFTRALMHFGSSIQGFWWAYLMGAGLTAFGIRRMWRTPRGRVIIDAALHKVPAFRNILRGLALARFSRVLGLSLSSGLGLIESLELAGNASGRPSLQVDVAEMARQVRTGGRLSDVLSACGYLTPFTRRMLSAGEQSAELPRMCSIVARHYERESSSLAKNISTVIEPVLIVAIAGVVLVVALAIFLPMWDMVKLMS